MENQNFFSRQIKSLLDSGNFSDCTFIIDGIEIKAHKLILTLVSPVFEKMFYGKLATDRIEITDILINDFKQMLQFVYNNKIVINSTKKAWNILYIGNKYMINDLSDICLVYIKEHMTIRNLVLNYEFSDMYGITELNKKCLSDICDYIRGVFYCDYHMKPSTIATILNQKVLLIDCEDLLENVIKWAIVECKLNIKNINFKNIINILHSNNISSLLTGLEFSSNKDPLIVEIVSYLKKIHSNNLSITKTTYTKKHWCTFCKCRQIYKIASRVCLFKTDYLQTNVSVNRNVLLFGLVVLTEDAPIDSPTNLKYNGEITVKITNWMNEIHTTKIKSVFFFGNPVYVSLKELIVINCDTQINIRVYYSNLDKVENSKSSILCHYMSSSLVDNKMNAKFMFDELNGSVIKGLSYYLL